MKHFKRVLILVLQLVMLFALLQTLVHGGMGALLGETFGHVSRVIIEFGVTIMCLFSSLLSFYLPSRRHRILRDAQVHLMKYISVLGLFQVLAYFLVNVTSSLVGSASLHPLMLSIMIMLYCMSAFMIPFNYVKTLFNKVKAVETRDPRNLVRQFFE
ncbi:hypothetical protein IMZ31_20830 (plasmid) [Pontibacillus sp. ALD_SL1]|uniref:hypothetical protein n=1 Tax=Pontibacillus sp. ALD_SL1 TaxID=2777185 RepID=UPI001A97C86F|nr:hypothetical protein [Pontibacillus sp. ALD_SL1]QST02995.1 hypothetical protein IMZ31_20830 [Pontibacillus sp. ALD_SL1]